MWVDNMAKKIHPILKAIIFLAKGISKTLIIIRVGLSKTQFNLLGFNSPQLCCEEFHFFHQKKLLPKR